MAWGTMQVGSLLLKETDILEDVTNANTGERTVRWEGSETAPSSATQADIASRQSDIMGLIDRILPVQFERKTEYNGYYQFTDTNTTLEKWGEGPAQVRWGLAAQYLGPDNSVDIESRLANVVRSNSFSLTGERWHAPAAGHYGYHVGAASPAQVVRQTDTGPITVYRSIPAGVNPRWGATVAGYQQGRARFLSNGVERISTRIPVSVTGWEVSNSLVRVRPATAALTTLAVAFWTGSEWVERNWDVRVSGDPLVPATHWRSVTVLRCDPEMVVVRVLSAQPTGGQRVLMDLVLRRGSRFVEGYVQRSSSGDLLVSLDVAEPYTSGTGYVVATNWNIAGVRLAAGSAKTFTAAANLGVSVTSSVAMDFWIGSEVIGAANGGAGDTNSGFEMGTSFNWSIVSGSGAVLTTPTPPEGAYAGRITATGGVSAQYNYGGLGFPGTPSTQYLLTGYLMSPTGLAASAAHISAYHYNSVPTFLSTTAVLAPALPAGVWTPVTGVITSPAGTVTMGRQAALLGTPAAGTVLHVDSLRMRSMPDSGDLVTALRDQYIGAMAEKVGVARR